MATIKKTCLFCGCAFLASRNRAKYCSIKCVAQSQKGRECTSKTKYNGKDYKSIMLPDGSIKNLHTVLAEKALGKPLPKGACVHHANGEKNGGTLVICENNSYHKLLHRRERALKACGHTDWRVCAYCKKYDDPKNLYIKHKSVHHTECLNKYKATWRKKDNKSLCVLRGN